MATKIMMPKLSDTMEEGIILKWVRKEGEPVKQGEVIAEIQTDKADMELEAYDSGVLRKIVIPEGGKVPVGALIAIIAETDEDISALLVERPEKEEKKAGGKQPSKKEIQPAVAAEQAPVKPTDGRIKVSPLARRMAQDYRIDLKLVQGTGPEGRIIKRDIEAYLVTALVPPLREIPGVLPAVAVSGLEYKDIELSLMRKTIAKRMQESKVSVPHFYVTMEINMKNAIEFRKNLNEMNDIKVTFTDIIVKAAAIALLRHPKVNSAFLGDKIRMNRSVNIGVAVALDDGIVTPVVRNCEMKSLGQIAKETKDLAERARERKLKPEEYQGGTFTVSNLGMFDVENFTAIINPPEGAILAVGAIVEKPVVENGQIVVGHTMKVTLSCDHRVIDGAVGAQFLQELKRILENPLSLVI